MIGLKEETTACVQQNNKHLDKMKDTFWGKDEWDISDIFFKEYEKSKSKRTQSGMISFHHLNNDYIANEFKLYFRDCLQTNRFNLGTLLVRGYQFKQIGNFLQHENKTLKSILDIKDGYEQRLKSFLALSNVKNFTPFTTVLNQFYKFIFNLYDERDEYDKDIWDVRKIMPDKINSHESVYLIKFENLSTDKYKQLAKKYIRNKLIRTSMRNCIGHLRDISDFCNYIFQKFNFDDLEALERKHVEEYLAEHYKNTASKNALKYSRIVNIKNFLEYIDKADYEGSPLNPHHKLIFSEDIPLYSGLKKPHEKYIQEDILEEIDANISTLPEPYIPIVILLRISGWRISDILNLKYNECLVKQKDGYYLQGDIKKTKVFGHKVPISIEMGEMIAQLIKDVKAKSTAKNNPDNFLFPIYNGHRIGKTILGNTINRALNKLCKDNDIYNKDGEIFSCTNHAFRHTKAVELINNGMNLIHVQKWLAHASPKMTLHYAKILDTTLRKSWEEVTKNGLFKLDETGVASKINTADVEDEDIVEWEWIKHNLDAVRMPLGYCMKPNKMECATQLNPCLTCRSLCTTPEFIPAFEQEVLQTREIINKGNVQKRTIWVEKNELLLGKLESVLSVLKNGKIKHDAGKQGREYVGEQRK